MHQADHVLVSRLACTRPITLLPRRRDPVLPATCELGEQVGIRAIVRWDPARHHDRTAGAVSARSGTGMQRSGSRPR